jgi:exopolysaccharide biosynthesis polyprenyl glycosylphosphotransferase
MPVHNSNKEQEYHPYMERKNITNTARLIISAWNIGLFASVWIGYYNDFTFDNYRVSGAIVSCVIYTIIYLSICNWYKAFRIASTNTGEIVFAQIVSYGIADLILYVECCLINNNYVDIFRGVFIVVLQGLGTALVAFVTKRYFFRHVQPKETLVIYGKNISKADTRQFIRRLMDKYRHLFMVDRILCENALPQELEDNITRHETVILYEVSKPRRGALLERCSEMHKRFYYTPDIEDLICQGSSYKQLLDTPLMKYDYSYDNLPEYNMKRAMDIFFSLFMLVLFSPLFGLTALCIKLEDHGPVFFRQKRCTKNGKVFWMIKFRSMVVDAEKDGVVPCVGNDARITKVGKVIRKYRIDELPQFINILKGEMSVVGPRPERVEHVQQYTKEMPEFSYRLRVKGGLTGYAQIYGKYNTSAYDKLRLDLMYIENQSLLEDLKIIILTVRTVFRKESTEGFSVETSRKINQEIQILRKSDIWEKY